VASCRAAHAAQRSKWPLAEPRTQRSSLAQELKSQAIGVILSGTGTDGTLGLKAIKAEGGIAIAQDTSAKFEGMPQSAITAGCVDVVLSPRAIAEELVRIARHPYVRPVQAPPPEEAPAEGRAELKYVYALLRRSTASSSNSAATFWSRAHRAVA
jgi:two-component system CheB/CheR fusion protein